MTARTADIVLGSGMFGAVAFLAYSWLSIIALVMPCP